MIPIVNESQLHQIIRNQKLVLVTFMTNTCPACRMQSKILERIEPLYHGRVQIVKLNLEENPRYAAEHELYSVPTTMFFKNGKLVRFKSKLGNGRTNRLIGTRDDKTIQGILNYLLSLS